MTIVVALAAALCAAAVAQAQPVIAIVQFNSPPDSPAIREYVEGLRGLGILEGRDARIERRYLNEDPGRIPAVLAELQALRPAVVFTAGHDIAKAAREQGLRASIVTAGSEDPVLSGLVKSLARPGENLTGVTFMSPQVAGKRLELLKLAVPGLARLAVVWDPGHFDTYYRDMGPSAAALGIKLIPYQVRTMADIDAVVPLAVAAGAQAVFVVPSRVTQLHAKRIAQACVRARVPAMSAYASFAEAGGLLAYGADIPGLMRSAAAQTRKILAGVAPGEIPVEQAQRFLFVVNRSSADAMGRKLSDELLLRADRVID